MMNNHLVKGLEVGKRENIIRNIFTLQNISTVWDCDKEAIQTHLTLH